MHHMKNAWLALLLVGGCSYEFHTGYMDGSADAPIIPSGGDQFEDYGVNDWIDTVDQSVSTFSVDVDTASYSITRRELTAGRMPDPASVRVEEFVNYFRYDDPTPDDLPFSVSLEGAPSFFGEGHHLLRIGMRAKEIPLEERDPVNLTFLIDVSGSMSAENKLGLVKYSLRHLIDRLQPSDTLSIVVYAGSEGVVLEPTDVSEKSAILDAIDALNAGGSTNGEAGIRLAYDINASALRPDGVNRVVLCSDGDFNVGATGNQLIRLIEDERERGIELSVLGFGMGNFNDRDMEQLANRGNGNYAYIDTPNEALRVLGDNLVGTLQVVAKDAKLQVRFDESVVERYRLIGYENRLLDEEDFADDDVDAGDIGAGHAVVAYYEVDWVEDAAETATDVATVAVRYKEPEASQSTEHTWTLDLDDVASDFSDTSDAFRFGAAVVEFAEILRESPHVEQASLADVAAVAGASLSSETPAKLEFLELVDLADGLFTAQ
jgi:Ca-activated chloride channel family protein